MSLTTDVGLAALGTIWTTAVVWYSWRVFVPWRLHVRRPWVRPAPKVRRSIVTWHLIAMGLLIASMAWEELLLQRVGGGWSGHRSFIGVAVLTGIMLGWDRLVTLWDTRPDCLPETVQVEEPDA